MRDVFLRLRAIFRRRTVEREIDQELRFHVDRLVENLEKGGVPREEAIRRAHLEFGGVPQIAEEYRDALGVRLLDDVKRDVTFALRSLRATPVVSTVAVLSLALAIGANSGIFSLINGLVLRPLPVREPSRLVLLTDGTSAPHVRAWSYPVWSQVRMRPELFDATTSWSFVRLNAASGGETQPVSGLWADGSFFDTLGVQPLIGRTFSARDDQRDGGPDGPVAVLSYAYWQRQFAGQRDVVGRSMHLNNVRFTVVGVTTAEFFGTEVGRAFDVILPLRTESVVRGQDSALDSAATNFLSIMARLKPGQPLDAATGSLQAVQHAVREATVGDWDRQVLERYLTAPFTVVPAVAGYSNLRRAYQRPLLTIAVVVGLVLLIACVNIANLLLARATARRHEMSLRLALGGSRWRLARQLLTESVLLSALGAALGMGLAVYGSRFVAAELVPPANLPALDLSLDGRVLAFTIIITVVTALLFGTAPAFQAGRGEAMGALEASPRTSTDVTGGRLTQTLVVLQVAFSVVLVVAAGLFLRSFVSLTSRPLGMALAPVMVAAVDPPRTVVDPAQRLQLYLRAREAVLALPNVADAAISHIAPLDGGGFTPAIRIDSVDASGRATIVDVPANRDVFGNLVSPRWFHTFGTRIVTGRDFTDADRRGAPRVAIVNQALARRLFDGESPIGRMLAVYPNTPRALSSVQIVGVVEDAVYASPREAAPPTWYVPIEQFDVAGWSFASTRLSVRVAAGTPGLMAKSITAAVAAVDPQLFLTYRPLEAQFRSWLNQDRLIAQLAGFFGGLALLLAGLGLYGVTAYAVSRRRSEIGIRMALGAAPMKVVRLVVSRVALLVAAGVALGTALSFWASRYVATLLFGLEPQDPVTLAGAGFVMVAMGALAAWLPARRATRIDPVSILRQS